MTYIELDEEIVQDGRLVKSGRRMTLPLSIWCGIPLNEVLENLNFNNMNPIVKKTNWLQDIITYIKWLRYDTT